MKRQNSHLSSTSRRDTPSGSLRTKSIGCMSGIVHLLSKYQNRHKKSLTFGKGKQEKDIIVFSSSPSDQILVSEAGISPASPPAQRQRRQRSDKEGKGVEVDFRRRISCDLPTRSPTLSAEIRRSSSVNSPTTIGTSPALVARLMGLEAVPPAAAAAETSNEKRRKLLGALEKCDNDLKALKEIIMAFRSPATPMAGNCLNHDEVRTVSVRKCRDCNCGDGERQPSAASVLDESSRLHLNRINRIARGREIGQEIMQQQVKKKKNPAAVEEEDIISISSSFNPTKLQNRMIKLQNNTQLETKASTVSLMEMIKKKNHNKLVEDDDPPLTWRTKANNMAETMNEISNEISWGFKREMAKIGMALQHHIYRDLIDEMVTDYNSLIPPFEACRRRLRF